MRKILSIVLSIAFILTAMPSALLGITAEAYDITEIDYWDGTKATSFAGGTGTQSNPYIIKTAEQLALCCLGQNPTSSTGKYYKVDDSIKVFVMQPENIVDLDKLLSINNADDVKEYLAGLSGVKNWLSVFNRMSFNGTFDGNGATIFGLYADAVTTSIDDCGLFPQFDGGYIDSYNELVPTSCKNITVKNSCFISKRRLGVIAGAAYGTNYGAKVDGKVMVDTCAVINCYLEGKTQNINHYTEQGVVVGGGAYDIIQINNILVKGCYAYDTVQNKSISIIGASSILKSNGIIQTKVTNSVFLGVTPYKKDYYSESLCQPYIFENVVTDAPTENVVMTNPSGWASASTTKDFTGYINQVSSTGFDFQTEATVLDWENTWFMSENGPELRAFHNLIQEVTNTTHIWKCKDCDITSPDGVQEHNFTLVGSSVVGDGTDVYVCAVCNYECKHLEQTDIEYDAGDCVTASGYYSRCKFCDWYVVDEVGTVKGHTLTYYEADPGHCEQYGHSEYWECSECKNKFGTYDIYAPMDSALTDEHLNTGFGCHIKTENDGNYIIVSDKEGHWYQCSICDGKLDFDDNLITDVIAHERYGYKIFGNEGHTLSCTICGYEGIEIEPHNLKDFACTVCGWRCQEHNFVTCDIVQQANGNKPELTEQICSVCNYVSVVITKQAPNINETLTYPINGSYDADIVFTDVEDEYYVSVDDVYKYVIDDFTGYDYYFCVNALGNGTVRTPYIIETANQFAAVVTGNLKDANGAWIDTEGIHFKIADNIYGFNLNNTYSTLDFSSDNLTSTNVENELENASVNSNCKWQNISGKPFKGSFDGNGACVYGLKADADYAGIFPKVGGNVTVKNLTVKNCYFIGQSVSALFGNNANPGVTSTFNTKHNIYNCSVYSNVLVCKFINNEAIQKCGVLIGQSEWPTESCLVVNDCLVYDNVAKHIENDDENPENRNIIYGLVANLHRKGSLTINNSIIMDSAPHALYYGSNAHFTSSYNNLYTDKMGIPKWENIDYIPNGTMYRYTYYYTLSGGIPTVGFNRFNKNNVSDVNNAQGYSRVLTTSMVYQTTQEKIKSSTQLEGIDDERWTYRYNDYPLPKIYKTREYSAGSSWSGEIAYKFTDGEGTKDSPYTIYTAEEFAFMLLNTNASNHYKLMADIIINDTSIDNWTQNARSWFTSNDVPAFEGCLDGNGCTVSGIYYDGNHMGEYAGLIPVLGSGAEVKNIKINNSQFNANNGTVFGALAGSIADSCKKQIRISAVTVDSSVIYSGNILGCGIVGKVGFSALKMSDCISKSGGLINQSNGKATVNRCISIGAIPFGFVKNVFAENVYTNINHAGIDGVTVLNNTYMQGNYAKNFMPGLNIPTNWAIVSNDYPTPVSVASTYEGEVGEVWSGEIATRFAGGSGTKEDPYIIETAEQLAYLVYNGLKGSVDNIKHVKLVADIYLNDVYSSLFSQNVGCTNWFTHRTVKSYNNISHINFDGDGHIIHGLFFDNTNSNEDYVRAALFPMLGAYSTVQNVGLSSAYMVGRTGDNGVYYNDAIAGFVASIDDFDRNLGLDSHDGYANREILMDPANDYENMAVKIKNCFIDHRSYFSGYYTGGFIANPYAAPILENCIFTGSIGGHNDQYYTGLFTGCDSSYGTQLRGCIAFPTTNNVNLVGGSAGSSWRTNISNYVIYADPVYFFNTKQQYGAEYIKISNPNNRIGEAAKNSMPLLDWADETKDGSGDYWTVVDGGTPLQTVFLKHRSRGDFEYYSCKKYNNPYVTISFVSGFDDIEIQPYIGEMYSSDGFCLPELTREGYKFIGWYVFEDLSIKYPFDYFPPRDMRLYAGWEKVDEPLEYDQLPYFSVQDNEASIGQTFKVDVLIGNNTGIVSAKLNVNYDNDVLELIGVENGDFANVEYGPISGEPFVINWIDVLSYNNNTNGKMATLIFKVKSNTEVNETNIVLEYSADDVYDYDFNNVYFVTKNSKISIEQCLYGDVNNDGSINNKDLGMLMQYINIWDVEINLSSADVNKDNFINNKDYGLLMQFINGWDVKLG